MENEDLIVTLNHLASAIEMVQDAIIIAKQGLNMNPTKEQKRQLLEDRLELEAKLQRLNGKLLGLASNQGGLTPPTRAQIDEIKSLTAEVEKSTQQNLDASASIVMTSKALGAATSTLSG